MAARADHAPGKGERVEGGIGRLKCSKGKGQKAIMKRIVLF